MAGVGVGRLFSILKSCFLEDTAEESSSAAEGSSKEGVSYQVMRGGMSYMGKDRWTSMNKLHRSRNEYV